MSLSEAYEALDVHLAAVHDDTDGFVIDSLDKADWAVGKIAAARRKLQNAELVAEARRERIAAWVEGEKQRYQESTRHLESLLEGYHRALAEEDPKAKTVKVPSGELRLWKRPDRWEFDEDFNMWAVNSGMPGFLRVKVEVDRSVVKRRLTVSDGKVFDPLTGALVPGVTVEAGELSFTVKTEDS